MSNPATLKNSLSGATARHKRSHIADLTAYFTLFPQRGRRVVMPIKHVWGGGEKQWQSCIFFNSHWFPSAAQVRGRAGGEGDWPFYRRKITQVAFRASPSSSSSSQQQQQQHQMGRISGPGWIRRIFPPMIHSRTLTFDESTRVSADVTAVRAMRNGSGDPSSCFRLLSRLIRLQSWELRLWTHTETYKRSALCAASSATQRQRTAEQSGAEREQSASRHGDAMRGHLLHFTHVRTHAG